MITEGFDLPANYIIHTPGPIWEGGFHREAEFLKDSYKNSLIKVPVTCRMRQISSGDSG
ncbi:O-acetyl-ADP-ribose deacetylase (regulator of RNase III) [Neobacillus niacini]|nr:O-acetyl-ADP-ribose deacetylase (regulator of RNase III) [Neobacillus niacini]